MGLRDRMRRSGPMWKELIDRSDSMLRVALVTGAAAGDVTVTGIRENDKLVAVLFYTAGTSLEDLTSEFIGKGVTTGNGAIVTGDDLLNNAGGTSSAGQKLLVFWEAYDVR